MKLDLKALAEKARVSLPSSSTFQSPKTPIEVHTSNNALILADPEEKEYLPSLKGMFIFLNF